MEWFLFLLLLITCVSVSGALWDMAESLRVLNKREFFSRYCDDKLIAALDAIRAQIEQSVQPAR